jgi:hypothetical protein
MYWIVAEIVVGAGALGGVATCHCWAAVAKLFMTK